MLTGSPSPERAILDDLAAPLGEWVSAGRPAPGGWRAGRYEGGRGDVVDLDTVRFVKQRRSPTRRVFWVAYRAVAPAHGPEPLDGNALYEVVPASGGGWTAHAVSWGLGGDPEFPTPAVNLGGAGWPSRFCAGGTVHGAGHEIARVRLCFANGVMLSDDAADGVVVFVSDTHVEPPVTAVLLNEAGTMVGALEVIPGD